MRVWGNHHRNGYGYIKGASPPRVLLLCLAVWIKDSVTDFGLSIPETTHEADRSFVQGCLD